MAEPCNASHMNMRHRVALAACLVLLSTVALEAGRIPPTGAAALAKLDCRGACFAFAHLSCTGVEIGCGRDHGIVVLEGLPFDCADVEPVACGLGLSGQVERCLAVCGGEDYPYSGE